jgi:hypothetical protein
VFATDKEREFLPPASQSPSTNIIQSIEKHGSKIDHRGLTPGPFERHGKIEVTDQICVTILFHGKSINIL